MMVNSRPVVIFSVSGQTSFLAKQVMLQNRNRMQAALIRALMMFTI